MIEIGWLPQMGPWTDEVHGTVFAGMCVVGLVCVVALGVRAYRLMLQGLVWITGC